MKKTYEKPQALIQNMAINGFVAGACSAAGNNVAVINYSETSCRYSDSQTGLVFFSSQCKDSDEDGVDIVNPNKSSPAADLCYHRPLDTLNFFSS
ncbi:MAG: hypothetical protein MJ120_05430 [Clostridia bacterium]|nr:hypothetical protein [Clostridia bacterium]